MQETINSKSRLFLIRVGGYSNILLRCGLLFNAMYNDFVINNGIE